MRPAAPYLVQILFHTQDIGVRVHVLPYWPVFDVYSFSFDLKERSQISQSNCYPQILPSHTCRQKQEMKELIRMSKKKHQNFPDFLPFKASFQRRFTLWGPAVIDGSFQASCAFQNLEALKMFHHRNTITRYIMYVKCKSYINRLYSNSIIDFLSQSKHYRFNKSNRKHFTRKL